VLVFESSTFGLLTELTVEPPHPHLVAAAEAAGRTMDHYLSSSRSVSTAVSVIDGNMSMSGASQIHSSSDTFALDMKSLGSRAHNPSSMRDGSVVGLVYVPRDELLVAAFSRGVVKVGGTRGDERERSLDTLFHTLFSCFVLT